MDIAILKDRMYYLAGALDEAKRMYDMANQELQAKSKTEDSAKTQVVES